MAIQFLNWYSPTVKDGGIHHGGICSPSWQFGRSGPQAFRKDTFLPIAAYLPTYLPTHLSLPPSMPSSVLTNQPPYLLIYLPPFLPTPTHPLILYLRTFFILLGVLRSTYHLSSSPNLKVSPLLWIAFEANLYRAISIGVAPKDFHEEREIGPIARKEGGRHSN